MSLSVEVVETMRYLSLLSDLAAQDLVLIRAEKINDLVTVNYGTREDREKWRREVAEKNKAGK